MLLYICVKFHENISNGFWVTERTRFCDRRTDRWLGQKQYVSQPTGGRHNYNHQLKSGLLSTWSFWLQRKKSRSMTKPTKLLVRPVKTQISLGIHPVWSESSMCTLWVAKEQMLLHADSEDSDQTGLMSRPIWVVTGTQVILLGSVMLQLNFKYCQESCRLLLW